MALADLAMELLYWVGVLGIIGFAFEEGEIISETSNPEAHKVFHKALADFVHGPIEVGTDNTGAYHLSNSTTTGQGSRHVERKVFKMRELKHNGIVKVIHVPTAENASDIFTKVLDTPTFQRHLHTIYNSAARPRGG